MKVSDWCLPISVGLALCVIYNNRKIRRLDKNQDELFEWYYVQKYGKKDETI